MKKRHIVMVTVLVLFALIMFGIKDSKNVKNLTCTVNGEFLNMESLTTLKIKVKGNKIKDMDIIIDAILPKESLDQKQDLINSFNASGKMKATSTKEGIRFQTGMYSNYFKALKMNTKSSYSDLKSTLELEGFSCK